MHVTNVYIALVHHTNTLRNFSAGENQYFFILLHITYKLYCLQSKTVYIDYLHLM